MALSAGNCPDVEAFIPGVVIHSRRQQSLFAALVAAAQRGRDNVTR